MEVRTGGPIIHAVFCTLAGILFIAFFISAAAGPAWWNTRGEYHYDSWLGPVLLLVGLGLLFQIVLGIWVGIDANRRGMNGFLWGALTAFTCVVGLLVYLLSSQSTTPQAGRVGNSPPDRPTGETFACPECGSATQAEFLACPHCGASLQRTCPQCARQVEPGWKFCSYCKTNLNDMPAPR